MLTLWLLTTAVLTGTVGVPLLRVLDRTAEV